MGARLGIGAEYTYITFPNIDHSPDHMAFDHGFKVGIPKLTGLVVSGRLKLEGKNPGDWYEVPSPADIIPTQANTSHTDGIVLTFPTGKADLKDVTQSDRTRLEEFVTNKARNIAVLSESFNVSAARP